MWTAKLGHIDKKDRIAVTVIYSDGENEVLEVYRFNKKPNTNHIRRKVRDRIAELEELYQFADNLNEGADIDTNITDPIPEPTPEPEPPTQEELDKRDFIDKLTKLEGILYAANMGLIANDDPRVEVARRAVISAFKIEYLNLLASRNL